MTKKDKLIKMPIVFVYHAINDIKKKGCISLELIKEHLDTIKEEKWQTLNLKQLQEYFTNKKRNKVPAIVLTFDDGYIEIYDKIFPLCKKMGLAYTVFVTTNYIGKDNSWNVRSQFKGWHLQASQIKEMADQGIDIGSHGMSHNNLLKLTEAEIDDELRISKNTLEKITGKQITAFSYPYGDYNDELLCAVKKYYKVAFGTAGDYQYRHVDSCLDEQILAIPRIDANYLSSGKLLKNAVFYNSMYQTTKKCFMNLYKSWRK